MKKIIYTFGPLVKTTISLLKDLPSASQHPLRD